MGDKAGSPHACGVSAVVIDLDGGLLENRAVAQGFPSLTRREPVCSTGPGGCNAPRNPQL